MIYCMHTALVHWFHNGGRPFSFSSVDGFFILFHSLPLLALFFSPDFLRCFAFSCATLIQHNSTRETYPYAQQYVNLIVLNYAIIYTNTSHLEILPHSFHLYRKRCVLFTRANALRLQSLLPMLFVSIFPRFSTRHNPFFHHPAKIPLVHRRPNKWPNMPNMQ